MPKFTDKSLQTPGGIASYDDRGLSNFHLVWESGTGTIKTRLYSTGNGFEQSVNAVYGVTGWSRDDDASPSYLNAWSKGAGTIATYSADPGSGVIVWSQPTRVNYHVRQYETEDVSGTTSDETVIATTDLTTLLTLDMSGQYVTNNDIIEVEASCDVYDVGTGSTWETYLRVDYNSGNSAIASTYRKFIDTIHGPQMLHLSGRKTLSGITGYVTDLQVKFMVAPSVVSGSIKIHGPIRVFAKILRG